MTNSMTNPLDSSSDARPVFSDVRKVRMEPPREDRPARQVTQEQLDKAIKVVNDFVDQVSPGLEFSVDTYTNLVVVKVVDPETKKVLRQFPSEEMLQIASAIDNMKGLLINQKT